MAHCIPSKDLQYQLPQGKHYRLHVYLKDATPLIVYGAESMFASKDDQHYYYRGVHLLFVSFSTVFMQDSHCLMTPQIAYSGESIVDVRYGEFGFCIFHLNIFGYWQPNPKSIKLMVFKKLFLKEESHCRVLLKLKIHSELDSSIFPSFIGRSY
jgi:hypothetical protein